MKMTGFLHRAVAAALIGCCAWGASGYFLKTDVHISAERRVSAPEIAGFKLKDFKESKVYGDTKSDSSIRFFDYVHENSGAEGAVAFRNCSKEFLHKHYMDEDNLCVTIDCSSFKKDVFDESSLAQLIDYFCLYYKDYENIKNEKSNKSNYGGPKEFRIREFSRPKPQYDKTYHCFYSENYGGIYFYCYDLEKSEGKFENTFEILNSIRQKVYAPGGREELKQMYHDIIYGVEKDEDGKDVKGGLFYEERCKKHKNKKENENKKENLEEKLDRFSCDDFIDMLDLITNRAALRITGSVSNEKRLCECFEFLDRSFLKGREKSEFKKSQPKVTEEKEEGSFSVVNSEEASGGLDVVDVNEGRNKLVNYKYSAICSKKISCPTREGYVIPTLKGFLVNYDVDYNNTLAEGMGYKLIRFYAGRDIDGFVMFNIQFYGDSESGFERETLKNNIKRFLDTISQEKSAAKLKEEYEGIFRKLSNYEEGKELVDGLKNEAAFEIRNTGGAMAGALRSFDTPFAKEFFVLNENREIKGWDSIFEDAIKDDGVFRSNFYDKNSDDYIIDVYKYGDKKEDDNKCKDLKDLIVRFKGNKELEAKGTNINIYFSSMLMRRDNFGLQHNGSLGDDFNSISFGRSFKGEKLEAKKGNVEAAINNFKNGVKNYTISDDQFKEMKEDLAEQLKAEKAKCDEGVEHEIEFLEEGKRELESKKKQDSAHLKCDKEILARREKRVKREENYLEKLKKKSAILKKDLDELNNLDREQFQKGIKELGDGGITVEVEQVKDRCF